MLPAAEVVNHARRVAERFNALPPGAVRETKKLLRRAHGEQMLDTIGVEGRSLHRAAAQPGGEGGIHAFFQKRKPDFSQFS